MFLVKSRSLGTDADSLSARLRKFFRKAKPTDVYTISQISDELNAYNADALATALARLSAEQIVDQIYRVESAKSRGGIQDFTSLASVPDVIFDWRQDREVEVHPEMVRVLFRRHDESEHFTHQKRASA